MKLIPERYQSMFSNSCYLLLTYLLLISCTSSHLVEKKSPEGLLIERYAVINVKGQEVKHGKYERFDEQGKLAEQSTYDHGKLNGIRNLYQSGILESEETRVNDQFNGPYKAYHPNGKLKMEANYIKDVITGNVKVYYPSGTLKEIVRFADNVEDGPFTEYFENGKIKAEGTYKQSDGAVEDGELKLYDTTGMMIRIMNCELGKCTTKWVKDSIQL